MMSHPIVSTLNNYDLPSGMKGSDTICGESYRGKLTLQCKVGHEKSGTTSLLMPIRHFEVSPACWDELLVA